MREGRSWRAVLAVVAAATCAVAASPLHAGTVYVPLAGEHTVGGVRYSTQIWVSNDGDADRQFTTRFVPNNSDGTKNVQAGGPRDLAGQRSTLVTELGGAGALGVLELTGSPQLFVDAQLVAGGVVRASLPVISSANVFAAGATAAVQGFVRSSDQVSGLTVVNLGHAAASCTVAPWTAAGKRITNPISLSIPALTQQAYGDALGAVGEPKLAGARFTVTCSQPFFVFGMVYRPAAGEAYLLQAAASASSQLAPPSGTGGGGGGGGGGGQSSACPTGATCFTRAGAFFTTTQAEQHRYYKWALPEGTQFRRVEVTFTMTLNKWDKNKNGFYTMFYMPRRGQWFGNALGLIVARQKGVVSAETAYNLEKGVLQVLRDKTADLSPGQTYEVYYVYDAENRRWEMKVKHLASGQYVVDVGDKLWSTARLIEPNGWFGLQFSDPYIGGTDHVPLWATWKDLVVAGFH